MNYYIADCHFFKTTPASDGEKPMPLFKARGFDKVTDMNEYIINKWNEKVTNKDSVYILGDFSNGNEIETENILKRLKGHKILLLGNHDDVIRKNKKLFKYFEKIENYLEIEDDGSKIILSHYPILFYNKSKNDDYMFYGHIHDVTSDCQIMKKIENIIIEKSMGAHYSSKFVNTYCEFSDYTPLTKSEWLEIDKKQKSTSD